MEDRETRRLAIRIANDDDVPRVMDLVRACVAELRRNGIEQWDEIYPDEKTLRSDAQSRTLYLAEDDGGLLGVFVINEYQDPEYADVPWRLTAGRVAVLHRLMVHPLRQRQGMARRLTQWAETHAGALGYDVMRLDAFTRNPRALRLYEQLGFRDAGGVMLRKGPFRCFEKRLPASLAVVGYPELRDGDRQWVESIRAAHDPQAGRLPAHVTLVFPAPASIDDVTAEAAAVARETAPIRFVINRVEARRDALGGPGGHVFLVASEGGDRIAALHDRLCAGAFHAHLRIDIPFVPHITVAADADFSRCEALARHLNQTRRTIAGRLQSIEVVRLVETAVAPVSRYALGGC